MGTAYNLTKDIIVISTEIYDANKNFVRKLSPACVIVATSADGSFITFSKYLGASATNLFSQIDNFFAPDEDKSRQTKAFSFEIDKLMLTSKADAEKLLPSKEKVNYEFLTYPELQGNAQYNTNHILDDDEFVTPENVYYQVGIESKTIDPVTNENRCYYKISRIYLSSSFERRIQDNAGVGQYSKSETSDKKLL